MRVVFDDGARLDEIEAFCRDLFAHDPVDQKFVENGQFKQ